MKYALVDRRRQTAQRGLRGMCPECHGVVIAKCGTEVVHHWAHEVKSNCNSRWENEGPWHQAWKNHFAEDWQEVVHFDDSGEKHIADVKTDRGWVIELQHSFLQTEERRSRNAFYCPRLIWVVNALRRPTDASQFEKMMTRALCFGSTGLFWAVSPDNCRLVREWSGSDAQIIFDFGPRLGLWWMLGRLSNDRVLFTRYTHTQFIEAHGGIDTQKNTDFDALVKQLRTVVEEYERLIRSRSAVRLKPSVPAPRRRTRRVRRR